jgi:uncharacterized protein YndB with AHSA1/START domain
MVPEQIERETVIAAPVERVWALLTDAEHLGRWFGDSGAVIDLRPGGAFSLSWAEHGTVRGVVVDVEPNERFAYRWTVAGDRDLEAVDGNSTLVEFTLRPAGDGTLLRVVESGFDVLETATEERDRLYADHTRGWGIKPGDLAEYAERVAV